MRVHDWCRRRCGRSATTQINARSSRLLAENSVTILKFFLHISKDEQKERFLGAHERPAAELEGQRAGLRGAQALGRLHGGVRGGAEKTSTEYAPWFVIPSNRKWFRDLAVSDIIVSKLESLGMKYPPAPPGLEDIVIE